MQKIHHIHGWKRLSFELCVHVYVYSIISSSLKYLIWTIKHK